MKRPPRAPVPVGDTVSALLDPVLRKKAGMTIGLVNVWADIVGSRLEAVTRPEKLVWPADMSYADEREFRPATLVVACEGASALRLQHQAGEVVERVNAFFGYRAVDRLKIVQKAVTVSKPDRRPKLRPLEPEEIGRIGRMVERIEDPKLRAALAAFGQSILSRNPMTKT